MTLEVFWWSDNRPDWFSLFIPPERNRVTGRNSSWFFTKQKEWFSLLVPSRRNWWKSLQTLFVHRRVSHKILLLVSSSYFWFSITRELLFWTLRKSNRKCFGFLQTFATAESLMFWCPSVVKKNSSDVLMIFEMCCTLLFLNILSTRFPPHLNMFWSRYD